MSLKDHIVAQLRQKKIKLWLQPYFVDGASNREELSSLAGTLEGEDSVGKVNTLMELQSHAVAKLEEKQSLHLKILGIKLDEPSVKETIKSVSARWAERVEADASSNQVLRLVRINPAVSIYVFADQLKNALNADCVRLIHKGKNILAGADKQLNNYCKSTILCLVTERKEDEEQNDDLDLIRSIRKAAKFIKFDVTDQHGRNVSMLPSERIAFLTALGLHRIGMQRSSDDEMSSCLALLLQADTEWASVSEEWRTKADNYGLLQLDIAWIYLKLESIDNLNDVVNRLDQAERVLQKQVHKNFVTLALAQADMGNPVPPLSAIFCRLFLLQGVAHRCLGDTSKSEERLDRAFMLCQSLRQVTSVEQVNGLCEALSVSEAQAISALRRAHGDSNKAATMIEEELSNEERQLFNREKQRKWGLCENTKDHVDVDLIPQLETVLELTSASDSDHSVAVGLLRLSNNDIQQSIDVYQEMGRDRASVLTKVAMLDRSLEARGLKDKQEVKVDETSLGALVSMGVDIEPAREALRKSHNNVDLALMKLTADRADDNAAQPKRDAVGMDSTANPIVKRLRTEREETEKARALIEEELNKALQDHDLEGQYFGSKLDEEWAYIEKFRSVTK